MEMPQALGHCVTNSVIAATSSESIASDITPDISNDMKNENVWNRNLCGIMVFVLRLPGARGGQL